MSAVALGGRLEDCEAAIDDGCSVVLGLVSASDHFGESERDTLQKLVHELEIVSSARLKRAQDQQDPRKTMACQQVFG